MRWPKTDKSAVPWLVLGLSVLLSFAAALGVQRDLERDTLHDFEFACDQFTLKVQERLSAHALVLQSGAAMKASGAISPDDWSDYTRSLKTVYGLESLQLFGFDDAGQPAGSASPAMQESRRQAADTGQVALSGNALLGPDDERGAKPAVYMYAPVYRHNWPRLTVAQRRAALLGWTYSAYRIHDLIDGLTHDFNRNKANQMSLQIRDVTDTSAKGLLYDNLAANSPTNRSQFFQERFVDFNGATWRLGFDRVPDGSGEPYGQAWGTLAGGLALSLTLFGLLQSMLKSRQQSIQLARRLNRALQGRESLLRISEENLRSTLDTLPYLLFEVDIGGRILSCHGPAEEMQVISVQGYVNRQIQEILPRAAVHTVLAALHEALLSGRSLGQKIALQREGERRWYELSVSRKPIQPDQPARLIVLSRDVTERERTRAALVDATAAANQANQAKSRFLAAASHDLRQPLSALALYLGVLKSRLGEGHITVMQSIDDCVLSLTELLTDLLDVSKLDAGVVKPQTSDFALEELLQSLLSVHGAKARLKGLSLRLRLHGEVVHTDRALLQRMLGNMIANAIRYTESGGVLVACRRRADRHWLEVWDTGIGIDADKTGIIFEEFQQLDQGARSRGSGLGLAIVAKSAALLGLQIRVASRPGRGSMFAIELPLGVSDSPLLPTTRASLPHRALRIALVEDNLQLLESLVMAFQQAGQDVVAAQDGAALVSQLGAEPPDVLLTDYRLGGGQTGLDVVRRVRKTFGADIPAMLLTGDTDPALIRNLSDQGLPLLFKPLHIESLLPVLVELTQGKKP